MCFTQKDSLIHVFDTQWLLPSYVLPLLPFSARYVFFSLLIRFKNTPAVIQYDKQPDQITKLTSNSEETDARKYE